MEKEYIYIYDKSPVLKMIGHNRQAQFLGNPEVKEVINTFLNLPEPHGNFYKSILSYEIDLLFSLFALGTIHGIRQERKRKRGGKNDGRQPGTASRPEGKGTGQTGKRGSERNKQPIRRRGQANMNDTVKEFTELLAKLDEKQMQRIMDFIKFLKGMDDKQRSIYETLERMANATYKGEPSKIYQVMEYALPKIRNGEAAADILNQYQQEGGERK